MIQNTLFFCVFPILLCLNVPVSGAEEGSETSRRKAGLVTGARSGVGRALADARGGPGSCG